MANIVAGVIGVVVVSAFLGFLMWWLKAVPLIVIMLGVICLMIYDVFSTVRANGDGSSPD